MTIYNSSVNMYNVAASYARTTMPPESFQSTLAPFGAPNFISMGYADPCAGNNFQNGRAVAVGKGSLLRRQMLVDKQCCEKIEQWNATSCGYHRYRTAEPSMCEMANMCSASSTLVFIQCNPNVDDGGVPGLKTPSSILALQLVRGQVQDQALRYA